MSTLKERRKLAQAKYYLRNKREIRANQAQYRRLNRAEINAKQREARRKR